MIINKRIKRSNHIYQIQLYATLSGSFSWHYHTPRKSPIDNPPVKVYSFGAGKVAATLVIRPRLVFPGPADPHAPEVPQGKETT